MAGPVIDQLNIISSDFDATLKFYRALGVAIQEPGGLTRPVEDRYRSAPPAGHA